MSVSVIFVLPNKLEIERGALDTQWRRVCSNEPTRT